MTAALNQADKPGVSGRRLGLAGNLAIGLAALFSITRAGLELVVRHQDPPIFRPVMRGLVLISAPAVIAFIRSGSAGGGFASAGGDAGTGFAL